MTSIRVIAILGPIALWLGRLERSPIPLTFTLAAPNVVGGNGTTATISFGTIAAPTGGAIVTITQPAGIRIQAGANQAGAVQTIGSTQVKVPAGEHQITVSVLTAGVAATTVATITATSGTDVAAVALTIVPARPRAVAISPPSVVGTIPATATILLDGAAPTGTGTSVALTAAGIQTGSISDGSVRTITPTSGGPVSVPATVVVPPGASSVTVPITTTPVFRDSPVNVTASLGSSAATGVITVKPPTLTQLLLAPNLVLAGTSTTGTVSLTGPAPSNGFIVFLSSTAGAAVPVSIAVPSGASSANFTISPAGSVLTLTGPTTTGGSVTNVVISARPTASPPAPSTITDGTSNTLLLGEAPALTATLRIVSPPVLHAVSANPSTVVGGDSATVSLSFVPPSAQNGGTALVSIPSVTLPAGSVLLTTDQPGLIQLPSKVDVSTSSTIVPVRVVTTAPPSDATATVQASFGGRTAAAKLLIKAPVPAIESFSIRPTKATGGTNLIASIKLSPSITTPTVVSLSSDRPDLIQVAPSATITPSLVASPLTLKTQTVTAPTTVTITATVGTQRIPVAVTLVP